jgi:NCAIR mutase (PurE)-related protein
MGNDQPTDRLQFATPDVERARRKGVPEVILADRKLVEQALAITCAFLARNGRAGRVVHAGADEEESAQRRSLRVGAA